MHLHIIACQVFYREISFLASQAPNTTWVTWLPQGMHDTPDLLRRSLQAEIDRIDQGVEDGALRHVPDYVILGYGLCSNGVCGLSSRRFPLVIPRTDDCIGVFLGSQRRYLQEFENHPGTYWLNNGWLETAYVPTLENQRLLRKQYAELYGEENADFLADQQNAWTAKYTSCGYISSKAYSNPAYTEQARRVAEQNHWEFLSLPGDLSLLQRLLNGEFDQREVLICPPGKTVSPSYDEKKICFV